MSEPRRYNDMGLTLSKIADELPYTNLIDAKRACQEGAEAIAALQTRYDELAQLWSNEHNELVDANAALEEARGLLEQALYFVELRTCECGVCLRCSIKKKARAYLGKVRKP